jgi:hemoglobin
MSAAMRPARHLLATLFAIGLLVVATPALAQAQPTSALAAGPDEAALLQALGRREGIAALVGDLIDRSVADPRTAAFFKGVKPQHLKQQISDQLCQLLGGGCVYDGETMKNAHASLKIARKDFLVLVELLQDAMDAQGIPFAVQNRLLARLAPMHRDIVTR